MILDSNAIISDFRIKGAAIAALFRTAERGEIDIGLPQVALKEILRNYRQEVSSAHRKSFELQRQLAKLGIEWPHSVAVESHVSAYQKWLVDYLGSLAIELLGIPHVSHDRLLGWDLADRKPFKPDGRGYRDALIWSTVLEVSRKRTVLFVSADTTDFAASREKRNEFAPELRSDLASFGGGPESVELFPRVSDLMERLAGREVDIVDALNAAFERRTALRSRLVDKLQEALPETADYDIEVEGADGRIEEVVQEVVHEPSTLKAERATPVGDSSYLVELYAEADIDLHITWEVERSGYRDPGIGHNHQSTGTTATLWYSVEATYDRDGADFRDVGAYGSAHGTVHVAD